MLLDLLSLAARIEGGRYEPVTARGRLARARARRRSRATGTGATVQVEPDAVERGARRARAAAARHGGVEVQVSSTGRAIVLEPVAESAAPIVLGEEQKDLGAAVAVRLLRALGGEVALEGERLTVTLADEIDPPMSLPAGTYTLGPENGTLSVRTGRIGAAAKAGDTIS